MPGSAIVHSPVIRPRIPGGATCTSVLAAAMNQIDRRRGQPAFLLSLIACRMEMLGPVRRMELA